MKQLISCLCLAAPLLLSEVVFSQLSIEPFVSGLSRPVDIANAGDGSHRLFIVEKAGLIRIVEASGNVLTEPFLDIISKVDSDGGEEGLLGLVFHPDYQNNGNFFVYYINTIGSKRDAVLERYTVSVDPNKADPGSGREVLRINQPQENHNGGDLSFGPAGNLYVGVGDGGSGNDPGERSQNLTLPLGKMLRINVDDLPYTIPPDNPYANAGGDTVQAIWAIGLRNPWRFSFDDNFDLWIGDVGQRDREEINFVAADDNIGGLNYGWDCREGDIACPGCGNNNCNGINFTEPVYWYGPGPGLSVTGGYVLRGDYYNAFEGHYIFAEYAQDQIRTLQISPSRSVSITSTIPANNISTFGEDEQGRVYAANYSSGVIYRIVESGVLPVDLIAVHIRKEQKKVLLDWETGFEFNASHFEVERSLGETGYKQIGVVPSKGNSAAVTAYQFVDDDLLPGHYFYRLKAIDIDGTFTYSMNLDIEIDLVEDLVVLPNPALDKIIVRIPKVKDGGYIQIVALDGSILERFDITSENTAGLEVVVKDFNRGLVLVQYVGTGNVNYTKKLMLY